MVGGQPVAQVRRQAKRLVTGTGKEVEGHSRSYVIALLDRLIIGKSDLFGKA
jgi:hypothetical protein